MWVDGVMIRAHGGPVLGCDMRIVAPWGGDGGCSPLLQAEPAAMPAR